MGRYPVARNHRKTQQPGSIADTVGLLAVWARNAPRGFARVEFHSEYARAEAERKLGEILQPEAVPYHRIELPVRGTPSEVVSALIAGLESLGPAVVSITGFASAVAEDARDEFLGLLTWNRENLAEFNHRQIWWMTRDFVDAFIRTVPDLNSWFMVRLALTEEFRPPAVKVSRFERPGFEEPKYKFEEAMRRATSLVERFCRAKELGTSPSDLMKLAASAADAIADVRAPNLTKELEDQLLPEAIDLVSRPVPNELSKVPSLTSLARLLHEQARFSEAEPLMRRALAIDERSHGPDHPDVARDLNNLAQLLQATNRLGEAEPLMRRALAIDEQSSGPDHPAVAIRLNNLALLLQATNRLDKAEPLFRRALAIAERSSGPDHPDVAIRLNNLASLLQDTNRLGEAEPLFRRALAIDEQSSGPDHPDVAIRLNNLASLLQDTNRPGDAEPLMRRALAIDEQSYGPDHPRVAIELNNLAQLLKATNRLGEAEPLSRRMLEIFLEFTRATGHEHPHLRAAIRNYTILLKAMGETSEQIRARLDEIGRPFGMDLGG
jgi:tetratricopeptide (TPR) repeat protein